MAKQDYYELSASARTASADDLKKAFRKLAMQHHPDRNPGDKDAEQQVQGDQRGLRRPEGRAEARGLRPLRPRRVRGRRRRAGRRSVPGLRLRRRCSPTSSTRCSATSRGGAPRRDGPTARPGSALQSRDHAGGGLHAAPRPRSACRRSVACEACHGTGAEARLQAAAPARPATAAAGVRAQQGFFTVERTCPTCHGAGQVIDKPCRTCARPGPRAAREDAAGQHPGRASRTARASASPARARPARAAARRAISTSSCRSRRTSSSSATAPTCIAACRSR